MNRLLKSLLLAAVLSGVVFVYSGCDVLGLKGNTGTVYGTVRNAETETGVPGALVSFGEVQVTTGNDGSYYIDAVPADRVEIEVKQRDFLPYAGSVIVRRGGNTIADVHLEPVPCLETVLSDNGMPFIKICKGAFNMGSYSYDDDERPVNRVTLTHDIFVGRFEVTQEDYEQVTGNNPSHFEESPSRPVEQVTWTEAIRFANALSALDGFGNCYDNNGNVPSGNPYNCRGYRLPTEAEWEYFARAGTDTDYSHNENFSSATLSNYAWSKANSFESTRPVGTKNPNPWKLHDVHGNVWEWVFDHYQPNVYVRGPTTDPLGPMSNPYRVIRGGSWANWPFDLRSSNRDYNLQHQKSSIIGFRLVRTAK